MYDYLPDGRSPLTVGDSVVLRDAEGKPAGEYIVDSLIGSGGFALLYLAHEKNQPQHFTALKELFPKKMNSVEAVRRSDGKIVFCRSGKDGEKREDEAYGERLRSYLEREVRLTRRAAALYDEDGQLLAQNNPDVFGIRGPLMSESGNCYAVIDTRDGKSLGQMIENGWETRNDKGVYRNNLLSGILEILLKTTRRLVSLHGDHRILHLDLSPANIYVSYVNGGQDLEPSIMDYGNARAFGEPEDPEAHRFTCNPYSAPEVSALAERNESRCDVDVTSDTYSIAAILFYAVLGEIYRAEKSQEDGWKEKIRRLYPAAVYDDFAEKLIGFFVSGLADDPAERFVTVQPSVNRRQPSLFDALEKLKKAYRNADILNGVPADELMSYILLDRYPLYEYFPEDAGIHVLCLGSGIFCNRMILSILSTGQMIGQHLNIHVVSADAETYRSALLSEAPLLKEYADFGDGTVPEEKRYVSFTFENAGDLDSRETCARVAEVYGSFCRYVIVSLGSNTGNITVAGKFAAEIGKISTKKTIIHYYTAEDSAQNSRAAGDTAEIPAQVELHPFGNMQASYNKDAHKLGVKAFRVAYLYERMSDPHISADRVMRKFVGDPYGQRSSAASAVHLEYKLASLNIRVTDPKISHRSIASYRSRIIEKYTEALTDPVLYGKLLRLEHIRWMLFMIADGYRLPDMRAHEMYSFRYVNGKFNRSFKCTDDAVKTHPCLVPCDERGVRLPRDQREWDRYTDEKMIDASDYDELDKVSLSMHRLARERAARPSVRGKILSLVDNEIAERLYLAEDGSLRNVVDNLREELLRALNARVMDALPEKIEEVRNAFEASGIMIGDLLERLDNELAILREYLACRDYKASDKAIIDHLLWIKFSEETIMIRPVSAHVLSNIAAPLIIEPQKLIYIGEKMPAHVREFFGNGGRKTEVVFEACVSDDLEAISGKLTALTSQSSENQYIIDVTEADPFFTAAAVLFAEKNKKVGVISCRTEDFAVRNLMNYPCASVYALKTAITAGEVFELYGAKNLHKDSGYMLRIMPYVESLWELYRNNKELWGKTSVFFSQLRETKDEFFFKGRMPFNKWEHCVRRLPGALCRSAGLREFLEELERGNVLGGLNYTSADEFDLISFSCPEFEPFKKHFLNLIDNLSGKKLYYTVVRNSYGCMDVNVNSGTVVERKFAKTGEFVSGTELRPGEIREFLGQLEQRNMIFDLFVQEDADGIYVRFHFSSRLLASALIECLSKGGNILELYTWYEAKKTGWFGSFETNYSFEWSNEQTTNELDVILTHGLTPLVCSCKTSPYDKKDLYEIADISGRFSLNTRPVMIYASDKAKPGNSVEAVKVRAREMGIYLIDLNDEDVRQRGLGAELVRIAESDHP